MIAPHTLSNFQSLTKLIHLIINHFYSHCRSDWQIVLTKQNFSDSLCKGIISFLYFVAKLRIKSKTTKNNAPPPAGASLQLVPNSKFSLHPPHSTTAHCPPLFWRGGTGVRSSAGGSLQFVPNSKFTILSPSYSSHLSHLSHSSYLSHPSHNSKFRIHNS